MKYLGVILIKYVHDLYEENYKSLMNKIKEKLYKQRDSPCSLYCALQILHLLQIEDCDNRHQANLSAPFFQQHLLTFVSLCQILVILAMFQTFSLLSYLLWLSAISGLFCFIYFWLCWVFVSVRGLSLVVASGGHSSSRCAGLSLSRPLLLRSTGSRRAGSIVVAHRPSCSTACGILPDQGSNLCPLHWQADS